MSKELTNTERIAEIMDRHVIACPLETPNGQKEIEEYIEAYAQQKCKEQREEIAKAFELDYPSKKWIAEMIRNTPSPL